MRRRTVVIILITLIVVVFGLYFIMVGKLPVELMRPEIRKVYHYWGEVTPGTTEVRTIITIYNPNPVPIPLKAIEFDIHERHQDGLWNSEGARQPISKG